jgi:hypothetical protein
LDFISPYEVANLRICNSRVMPYYRVYANRYLSNDRFCFQNSKIGFGTLVPFSRISFVKTSEVDEELEYKV